MNCVASLKILQVGTKIMGFYFYHPEYLRKVVRDKEKLFRITELFVLSRGLPGTAALWKHQVMVFVGGKKIRWKHERNG